MTTFEEAAKMTIEELDAVPVPGLLPQFGTIGTLYDYSVKWLGTDEMKITMPIKAVSALVAHAQSMAVRDICAKHTAIHDAQAQRARQCRYHQMAAEVVGDQREIYDPRHGDMEFEAWDFEMEVTR